MYEVCEDYNLISESNSKNLSVPSTTGGIPGVFCSHPISSDEPIKVFRILNITLYQIKNQSVINVKIDPSSKKLNNTKYIDSNIGP